MKPPALVKAICAVVCLILDVKPVINTDPRTKEKTFDYWLPSLSLFADPSNFVSTLQNFNVGKIDAKTMKKINQMIPEHGFSTEIASGVS